MGPANRCILFLLTVLLVCLFCNYAFAEGFAQIRIVDENDEPVDGTSIIILDDYENVCLHKVTNDDGIIQWSDSELPDGTYYVDVNVYKNPEQWLPLVKKIEWESKRIRKVLETSPDGKNYEILLKTDKFLE